MCRIVVGGEEVSMEFGPVNSQDNQEFFFLNGDKIVVGVSPSADTVNLWKKVGEAEYKVLAYMSLYHRDNGETELSLFSQKVALSELSSHKVSVIIS
jgi:hypothetical protein